MHENETDWVALKMLLLQWGQTRFWDLVQNFSVPAVCLCLWVNFKWCRKAGPVIMSSLSSSPHLNDTTHWKTFSGELYVVTLGRISSLRLLVAFVTKEIRLLTEERWIMWVLWWEVGIKRSSVVCARACVCVRVLKHYQHDVSARSSLALNFFPLSLRSSVRLGNRLALSSAVGR